MFRCTAICFLLVACGGGASSTGIDTSTLTCPPDSTLTYATYGRLAMQDHCLACHAGKESPRLDTVEQIRTHAQVILSEAVATTAMPENGDMTLEEREMLGEWLACGAP
jgi:hypothetical protein